MNRYVRALLAVEKEETPDAVRRVGISVGDLVSRGLVIRRRITEKKYIVPEGAPSWAVKFRHTRKKYNVNEKVLNHTILKLTNRGKSYLKRYSKTKDDSGNKDKVDDVIDNPDNENY